MYIEDIVKRFLPSTAEIVMLDNPSRTIAVKLIDLDGDGELELVLEYYWQGENYIRLLKYHKDDWYVAATKKVKRSLEYPYPSKEELLTLKKSKCEYEPFSDEYGIDFLSIKYICSLTERDMKLEKAIKKEFDISLNEENIRYYYNNVDLNEDGIPEVFVFLMGPFVCGTGGCSAVILKVENGEYKTLSRFSLVRNPVIISNSKTNGYKDIIMYVAGGGIESFFAELKYDGTTYPSNPSLQPKVEPGTKVEGIAIVSDDISKSSGIDL